MHRTFWIAALAAGLTLCAQASDHIDGEVTKTHPLADLSDLYAFPTPGAPGHLTVVLNTHPFAVAKNHFSSKIDYRLTLRAAAVDVAGRAIQTQADSERVLTLHFDDAAEPHTMSCSGAELSRTVVFNAVDPDMPDGLRLFAGHRSDPFFFDALWATKTASKGKIAKKGWAKVTMSGLNVLSVVVEVDARRLFGADAGLIAIVAESVKADGGERLDRLGRPEVTNVSMVNHDDEPDLRDGFNGLAPFDTTAEAASATRARLVDNIAYYDALDGATQWTAEDAERYAATVADDFLLVDVRKPTSSAGYFTIEDAVLAGREPTAAGGRLLTDDIMDTLFTTLINHGEGPRMSDGVDAPSKRTSDEFPYLAAPSLGAPNRLKSWLVRKVSGIPGSAYTKYAPGVTDALEGQSDDHGHDHGHGHGH